jgi:excisionase family DNA binding protein
MTTLSAHTLLLNRKNAGTILGVSLRTVDHLISSGDLAVIRIGKSVRIRPEALDDFIAARESPVSPRITVRESKANPRMKGITVL